MDLIDPYSNYNFVGKLGTAFKISLILIVISIGSLLYHKGPNWGVEFTGGTEIHIKFDTRTDVSQIREGLAEGGYIPDSVQQFGLAGDNEFLVRFSPEVVDFDDIEQFRAEVDMITESITELQGAEVLRIDFIGPQVGQELVNKAILAILIGCVGILIYVRMRFEFAYAMGAVIALLHDTIITLGAISLMNKDFTLAIVAALLTVIGYSVNDTIVIFDRIRENLGRSESNVFDNIVNEGINQTLTRTIMTGITVFLVLLPLFFLGGSIIHDFAFTLIIGVLVGTYSSIFVSSGFLVYWKRREERQISKV